MREKVSELLEEGGAMEPDDLPEDYLLSFTPEAVVSHMHLAPELKETGAVVRPSNRGGYWSLLIMAKDRTGLLARICGVLALHNLNVLAAQIFTWRDGTAVDVLDVCSAVEGPYEGQDWDALTQDLNLALGDRLGLAHRLGRRHRSVGRGKPRVRLRRPAKVVIDNDISDFYTITEVYADDRPGLLYDITRTLSECGIDIFRAKIGTKVDQVVDVFYVLDKYGEKIDDPELQEELREALLHVVNNGAG
jgi:[protein-PII] uridylyltransferase